MKICVLLKQIPNFNNLQSGTKHESSSITVIMDPVIIKSPNSLTVATGSDVSLTCVYSGTPKPYFFWNKNDEVSTFNFHFFLISFTTSFSIFILVCI